MSHNEDELFSRMYAVLNKVYFREFDDEIAKLVIEYYNNLDVSQLGKSPERQLEVLCLPYRLLLESDSYLLSDAKLQSGYTAEQEV
jgi:hypothetical protein